MKRLVIADVSNLYYCIRKKYVDRRLDYEKYLNHCVGQHELFKAIAYGADMDNSAISFRTALHHLGYETRWKEPSRFVIPGSDRETRKADWDVGIAIEIIRLIPEFDILILGTADGDLADCVTYVREQGKRVEVIACGISKALKQAADAFHEIEPELLK